MEKDPWTRDSAGSGPWAPAEKGDIPVSTSGQGWEWSPDTAQGPARRPQTAGTSAGSRAQALPRAPLPAPRASVPRAPLAAPRASVSSAPCSPSCPSRVCALCASSCPSRVCELCFVLSQTCFAHAQLRPTLCDPMDSSPPGSSVHGIFQARVLEQVAISFSGASC